MNSAVHISFQLEFSLDNAQEVDQLDHMAALLLVFEKPQSVFQFLLSPHLQYLLFVDFFSMMAILISNIKW